VSHRATVFLPEALNDLALAYDYYDQCQSGLGNRFMAAVRQEVTRIENNPEIFGFVHHDIRAACLRRFPYIIFYRIEAERIALIAVKHGSRDWPSWIGQG
jgi:plasmid stabilization system protein ParE